MPTLSRLQLVIAIATAGRRETLVETLRILAEQQRLPDEVVIAPARPEDCDESLFPRLPFPCRVVHGPRGLTHQRNTILEATPHADVIAFLDDDFYLHPAYLASAESLFLSRSDVVGMTGRVLADGRLTQGIAHAEAVAMLARLGSLHASYKVTPSLYGCNMMVRAQPIRAHQLTFDTNLPLYGWLEDLDFTRRLARHGVLLDAQHLVGVHLATKRGRVSGVQFGYSQVANPLYLMRKGTMPPGSALRHAARNVARNLQRSLISPEPWIDRRGRLRGNCVAFAHLLVGRLRPENVMSLR